MKLINQKGAKINLRQILKNREPLSHSKEIFEIMVLVTVKSVFHL